MPTNAAVKHIEELSKKYRINFVGETNESTWPIHHMETLREARDLKNITCKGYSDNSGVESQSITVRALAVVAAANQCEHRNESTWRSTCEPLIFERFCSVKAHGNSSRLDKFFISRTDQPVKHQKKVAADLSKGERPDRICGLYKTRSMNRLLEDAEAEIHQQNRDIRFSKKDLYNRFVQESLGKAPVDQTGDSLLYPFMVLEAKSDLAQDSWKSIKMQTAFSIRTFLETQSRLWKETRKQLDSSGPLVWFLMFKGEDWKVCAAYTEDNGPRDGTIGATDYIVIDIWSGCISDPDHALQLLLLVDLIYVWARDIYREEIIERLDIIASGETEDSAIGCESALHSPIDDKPPCQTIFSVEEKEIYLIDSHEDSGYVSVEDSEEEEEEAEKEEDEDAREDNDEPSCHILESDHEYSENYDPKEAQAEYTTLKTSSDGDAIRHATFIESKFYSLYVTNDNASNFTDTLRDYSSKRMMPMVMKKLVKEMKKAILIDEKTLRAIEAEWTGENRQSQVTSNTTFYALITCTSYLDENWHQVRELSIIAIEKDAYAKIHSGCGWKQKEIPPPSASHSCTEKLLMNLVRFLRVGTLEETLMNAITRETLRILPTKNTLLPAVVDKGDCLSRDIVLRLYHNLLKKRGREPDDSFLRVSSKLDQQHLINQDIELDQEKNPRECGEKAQISSDGCVLLASAKSSKSSKTEYCVYMTMLTNKRSRLPKMQELAGKVRTVAEDCDIYHTARSHNTPSFSAITESQSTKDAVWEMKKGFCDALKSYTRILSCLETFKIPTRVAQECKTAAEKERSRNDRNVRQRNRSDAIKLSQSPEGHELRRRGSSFEVISSLVRRTSSLLRSKRRIRVEVN